VYLPSTDERQRLVADIDEKRIAWNGAEPVWSIHEASANPGSQKGPEPIRQKIIAPQGVPNLRASQLFRHPENATTG